jgi:hypothetical protein
MRDTIRTDARFKTRGKWWLPNNPDAKVSGSLRFNPKGGCMLKLVGSFSFYTEQDALTASFVGPRPEYPVIYGEETDGTPISLFDAWPRSVSHKEEIVFANRALVGSYHSDLSSRAFIGVNFSLDNLEHWLEHSVFTPESGFGEDIISNDQITAILKDDAKAEIRGDLPTIDGKIEFRRGLIRSFGSHSASCNYYAKIRVLFNQPKNLVEACEVAGRIANLFTLLIRAPAYTFELQLVNQKFEEATILAPRRFNIRSREMHNPQMPCPYSQIKDNLIPVVDGWLKVSQDLALVVALLFEIAQVKGAVLESKFFTIAQAVEGYCATTDPFTFEDDDGIQAFKRAIMNAIPANTNPDLRNKTSTWLEYANRPSLRNYMKKLFYNMDQGLKKNILEDWKEPAFIDYAVRVRNTIAHPSSGSVWDWTNHNEFRDVMDRLKLLVITKLLERAGMPIEVLQNRYKVPGYWTWA